MILNLLRRHRIAPFKELSTISGELLGRGDVSVPKRQIAPNSEAIASVKGRAMKLSDYLRRQAESCVAISRTTFDLTMARRLRDMAADLQDKAAELEDEIGLPPHMIAGKETAEEQRERD
jgi:hypothetical protein